MPHTAEQLHALVAACEQFRGSEAPKGYRDGLALCVIDSVQSTGVTYSSVGNVLDRYRVYRREQGGDPATDGAAELLVTFDECGGPDGWAARIGTRNRTSTRGGILKSEAIRDVATVLAAEGIDTVPVLRQAATDEARLEQVRKAWCAVKGQRSGITWRYVLMLAGVPGVKPDRMICRFVADALEVPRRSVGTAFAAEIVTAAAPELDMSATALDHAIWRFQRGRR
ncbi:hypothetical protein [Mycobacteroides abscessus]|uniref:hypothetical protein n=1 Tax=Mycobacteroides abscessus TaxID=36809 RepID=UPI000926427F|nr:hypothetical protein [Mycobacteroides abscessus]MBN7371096.1 hypothetical protein [Mycobacteroides abscessus subsp. abscessus]MBN7522605.1 hypothetical protein [Mycobacteroides abscessus subsp. abscessus]MDB2185168.1 hypothetical protein [Mycobacteroides abscessus subsp. abscessus]MDO3123479.1 hypothetical protein [Mycobacteroides abscessus subsp. abscessus]MDO3173290.1 hypothetical protein [Mycobacteroides abscessus subsp. abscessus]